MHQIKTVLVTGGAGYVGSVLVPKLLANGYQVKVIDLFLYGQHVFDQIAHKKNLTLIKGDIRDQHLLAQSLSGCEAVIHLACISNDPSFELNPELGKSINYDAFEPMVKLAKEHGVKRFIYASSSSVYGVKKESKVTENLSLEPLTDYSKFKAMCEEVLSQHTTSDFITIIVRPATVCGYSPRLRLDLIVNILTNHAYINREIKVFGGQQYRPNIHIDDMCDFYAQALEWPAEKVNGEIFNVGGDNFTVNELANIVQKTVGTDVVLKTVSTDDNRSYRVSSEKIKEVLNFVPSHTVKDAVSDLIKAYDENKIPNAMSDESYYNIKLMQKIALI